jgi:PIN domain nuclease of toxin-antitoxin system
MSAIVADTHALIWYFLEPDKLSEAAVTVLDQAVSSGDPIYLSTISLVEVCYLVEKRRLPEFAFEHLSDSLDGAGGQVVAVSLDLAIARAVAQIPRKIVPDMPDRIIAATALHLNLPLVTHDRKIQAAQITTIW